MKVHIKFLAVDIPNERRTFTEEVIEGTTINQLLKEITKAEEIGISFNELKKSAFLVNSTLADNDMVLKDGDSLIVLRTIGGG